MSSRNNSFLHRLRSWDEQRRFKTNRGIKHLFYGIALAGALGMVLVTSPSAIAAPGNGVAHRLAALENKEEIRTTLHAFVDALNSTFLSGATNPLGPIAAALHPAIVLSATPPPTPFDPMPRPMVFAGINQVIGGYGQVVVVQTRPNILASAIDVQLLTTDTAEADLRFANSVNFPAMCMLGNPGCAQVLLFADVHVTFQLSAQDVWQVTSVELVHHVAHGGPPSMMP